MNEKMERVVIEPGQTVEYLPGQTFVLLSDTKMQFKTASKFITQEDVVKNDVESKNTTGATLQTATGASVSNTVTVEVQVDVFPLPSVAVIVIVCAPVSVQVNELFDKVKITLQLSLLPLFV